MIGVTMQSTDASGWPMTSDYYISHLSNYRFGPDRSYSAHRLWMNLWTSLGQPADNSGHPGGNAAVPGRGRPGIHSACRRYTRAWQAPVGSQCPADLAGSQISPGSTDPMTTASLYLSGNPRTKQAGARKRSERTCWLDRRSGGGVR